MFLILMVELQGFQQQTMKQILLSYIITKKSKMISEVNS